MNVAPANTKELSTVGAESGVSLKSLRVESILNMQMSQPNQPHSSKPQENNSMDRHRFHNITNDALKDKVQSQNPKEQGQDKFKIPTEMQRPLQSTQKRSAIKQTVLRSNTGFAENIIREELQVLRSLPNNACNCNRAINKHRKDKKVQISEQNNMPP